MKSNSLFAEVQFNSPSTFLPHVYEVNENEKAIDFLKKIEEDKKDMGFSNVLVLSISDKKPVGEEYERF